MDPGPQVIETHGSYGYMPTFEALLEKFASSVSDEERPMIHDLAPNDMLRGTKTVRTKLTHLRTLLFTRRNGDGGQLQAILDPTVSPELIVRFVDVRQMPSDDCFAADVPQGISGATILSGGGQRYDL